MFVPTKGQVGLGQTITTGFTIQVSDTAGFAVTESTTSTVVTAVRAPAISNTVANQAVPDQGSISPFAAVVIADANAGQTESVTVTLSAPANGTLTNLGRGTYDPVAAIFADTGSAASVTADLDALVFVPTQNQVALGQTVTTGFTIADTDSIGLGVTDRTTSAIATAVAEPTISNTVANQVVNDHATIAPFGTVLIQDQITGQTETVTVVLSATANGSLSNPGNGNYNASTGVYTVLWSKRHHAPPHRRASQTPPALKQELGRGSERFFSRYILRRDLRCEPSGIEWYRTAGRIPSSVVYRFRLYRRSSQPDRCQMAARTPASTTYPTCPCDWRNRDRHFGPHPI